MSLCFDAILMIPRCTLLEGMVLALSRKKKLISVSQYFVCPYLVALFKVTWTRLMFGQSFLSLLRHACSGFPCVSSPF